jgi:hypothetical protein
MHIWCGAFCVLQLNSSKIWNGKYRKSGLHKLLRENAIVRLWTKRGQSIGSMTVSAMLT